MSFNPPFSPAFSVPNISVAAGTSAAAQAVIDLMTDLAAGEADKITASVDAGIAAGEFSFDSDTGLFSPIDSLFALMLESETNRIQDWFVDRVGSFVNDPTYVNAKGVSFNGTNEHFNTLDLTSLTNYALTDAYIEVFCYDIRSVAGTRMLLGSDTTGNNNTWLYQDATNLNSRLNSDQLISDDTEGVFADNSRYGIKRPDGDNQAIIKNGVQVDTEADADTAVPSDVLAIAARNDDGVLKQWIDATLSFVLIGATQATNYTAFADEIIAQWALDV